MSDVVDRDDPGLRRALWTFSFASFFHDIGAEMVLSVWPLYLKTVLGANMQIIGLIDGLSDAVVSMSQAVGGYISDRIGKRKVFVMIGYMFGGVARIGYSLASHWTQLIPFRVIDRSGKVRTSPRDAIIAELSAKRDRGEHFGILRLMDNLGSVVGVLFSMALLSYLGYRKLFLVASLPSFLAVALVTFLVPERRGKVAADRVVIHFRDVDRNFILFLIASAVFALGSFSYSFLLIAATAAHLPVAVVPIYYLLATFIAGISSLPFGVLSDRLGRKVILQLGFISWALVGALFLMVGMHPLVLVLAFILFGLMNGAIDTVQRVFVAELAPKHFVASTMGAFQMVIGLMSLPASLIAGFLWDKVGQNAPFHFALTLTAIASVLLLFVHERQRKR
jgi:MFS family permease